MCFSLPDLFDQVFFDPEVVDDKILPFGRILSHKERKNFLNVVAFFYPHRVKAHILANKMLEFFGGNFTQPFESGDFGIGT